MEGTVTISLKDFKRLEEAEEKIKRLEKEIVVCGRVRKKNEEYVLLVHKEGVEEFLKTHYNMKKIEWDEGFKALKMYEFNDGEKIWVVAKTKKEAEYFYNNEFCTREEEEEEIEGKEVKKTQRFKVVDEDAKEEVDIWELAEREYNEWAQIPFIIPAQEKEDKEL